MLFEQFDYKEFKSLRKNSVESKHNSEVIMDGNESSLSASKRPEVETMLELDDK